jgi:tRNA pseudouridine55 synthase
MNSRQIHQNKASPQNKHRNTSGPSGLLLLNKKSGVTSFEALGEVKRALATGKVGHTGTLDKFAEGLLVVLTGRALKLSTWFSHCDKHYDALVCFGKETDTLDPEGAVIAEADIPSREAVEKILPAFSGAIMQAPPAYSALHIDGKRASERVRSGESPEMKKRPVSIYELELLSWEPPLARFHVHCSSGTYIRSLARDIALAASSRAYLAALKRTKVSGFELAGAIASRERSRDNESAAGAIGNEGSDLREGENFSEDSLKKALLPIDKTVFKALGLPWFEIDENDQDSVQKIIHGKPLSSILNGDLDAPVAGVFCGDAFIAMIEKNNGTWKYGYVYAGGSYAGS